MKKKKRIVISVISIIVLIVVVVLFNIKFKKTASLNSKFIIGKNDVVSIKGTDLKISIVSVTDSRCRKDVQCIWQGEILYILKVNDKRISLSTVNIKKKEYKDYVIHLLDNNNSTEYVKLRVEEKEN